MEVRVFSRSGEVQFLLCGADNVDPHSIRVGGNLHPAEWILAHPVLFDGITEKVESACRSWRTVTSRTSCSFTRHDLYDSTRPSSIMLTGSLSKNAFALAKLVLIRL